ncbi:hypothetical protein [Azospirillum argentinense]
MPFATVTSGGRPHRGNGDPIEKPALYAPALRWKRLHPQRPTVASNGDLPKIRYEIRLISNTKKTRRNVQFLSVMRPHQKV